MDISGIKNLARDRITVSYVVSIAVMVVFAYVILVRFDITRIFKLRAEYGEAVQNVEVLKKAAGFKTYLKEFNSVFITNGDTNWLIEVLNELAGKQSIRFDSIRPLEPGDIAEYRIVRVEARGMARYINILRFIDSLENYKNRLFIEELELSSKETSGAQAAETGLMNTMPSTLLQQPALVRQNPGDGTEATVDFRLTLAFLNSGK